MSKVDPKWINTDTNTMEVIDNAGTNELAVKDSPKVNGSTIEVRTVSEGEPTGTVTRDDFYIEIPDAS